MVQMQSIVGDVKHNASKIVDFVDLFSDTGSEIICFPETCLTGYTTCNPIEYSIDSNNPYIGEIIKEAEKRDTIISFGLMEKTNAGPYITQMTIAPGNNVMKYRKTHLGHKEREVFKAGNEIPVMQTDKICLGIQLCWEGHIPEVSTVLRCKGAELILLPHSSGLGEQRRKEAWNRYLPARANDNGAYVAACNAIGYNGLGVHFGGGCIVLDPKGKIIAEKFDDSEGGITTELIDRLPRYNSEFKMSDISYFDSRRPELYKDAL